MEREGLAKTLGRGKSAQELRVVNYKEKAKFADYLFNAVENQLIIKKNKRRHKCINLIKEQIQKGKYEKKNFYVEDKIENL
jgi:hypothetical protein